MKKKLQVTENMAVIDTDPDKGEQPRIEECDEKYQRRVVFLKKEISAILKKIDEGTRMRNKG